MKISEGVGYLNYLKLNIKKYKLNFMCSTLGEGMTKRKMVISRGQGRGGGRGESIQWLIYCYDKVRKV